MHDVPKPRLRGRRAELLGDVAPVVDALPDLLDALPADRLPTARRLLRARMVRVRRGRWAAWEDSALVERGIGFLVVDGALMRCVSAAHRTCAELLGPGDLLRPAQDLPTPPFSAYWRAIVDTRLAVLDAAFALDAAGVPELTPALVSSVTCRAGVVGRQLVIVQSQAVEVRIMALMRHLAERWGVVTRDGIVVPEFLTHGTLSLLIGARRPSVTSAMVRLGARGDIRRLADGRYVMPLSPRPLVVETPATPHEETLRAVP